MTNMNQPVEINKRALLAAFASQDKEAALSAAGYSASALRAAGYSASALSALGYSASALRAAGYSASDLSAAGYSASDLSALGYSASDLSAAGYSASDLSALGYSASALRALGYSASALRAAGYSASALRAAGEIPKLERPYSRMLADIQASKRKHDQSTFGPESCDEKHVCGTPMCTAGHLVNMAGAKGYALKDKYGWEIAAGMLHYEAHPDWPCQNFGNIPQEWAMAYIEEMAAREAAEASK